MSGWWAVFTYILGVGAGILLMRFHYYMKAQRKTHQKDQDPGATTAEPWLTANKD